MEPTVIGYHYTTRSHWEQGASIEGLIPNTIRPHELERFRKVMPDMQDEAVWVWKQPLDPRQAWICSALLSCIHNDFDLVLLEIEYDECDSVVYYHPLPDEDDSIKLTCNFSALDLETRDLEIDLLINTISPNRIEKIWEADLLAQFQPVMELA